MPWTHQQDVPVLRMAYNVAFAAHANCARALTEALMRGDTAIEPLVEAETATRRKKEEARNRLHSAMARAVSPLPEPPSPTKPAR